MDFTQCGLDVPGRERYWRGLCEVRGTQVGLFSGPNQMHFWRRESWTAHAGPAEKSRPEWTAQGRGQGVDGRLVISYSSLHATEHACCKTEPLHHWAMVQSRLRCQEFPSGLKMQQTEFTLKGNAVLSASHSPVSFHHFVFPSSVSPSLLLLFFFFLSFSIYTFSPLVSFQSFPLSLSVSFFRSLLLLLRVWMETVRRHQMEGESVCWLTATETAL